MIVMLFFSAAIWFVAGFGYWWTNRAGAFWTHVPGTGRGDRFRATFWWLPQLLQSMALDSRIAYLEKIYTKRGYPLSLGESLLWLRLEDEAIVRSRSPNASW